MKNCKWQEMNIEEYFIQRNIWIVMVTSDQNQTSITKKNQICVQQFLNLAISSLKIEISKITENIF